MVAFLIRSQLVMAVSAALFVWLSGVLTGHMLAPHWYFVAFAGCWAVYLADAGLFGVPREDRINLPQRADFIERHRRGLIVALALVLGSVALGFGLGWPWPRGGTWLALAGLGVAGAGYVFPLLRTRDAGALRVKDVALWKPAFVSAVWLAGGLVLPFTEGVPLAPPAAPFGVVAATLFLMLLGDSIALDWRDRAGDAAADVQTAAVRFGRGCLALLGVIALATLVLAFVAPGTPAWRIVGGTMAVTHAASQALLPLANRRPLLFYAGVAAWRFTGALACLAITG